MEEIKHYCTDCQDCLITNGGKTGVLYKCEGKAAFGNTYQSNRDDKVKLWKEEGECPTFNPIG